MYAKCLSTEAAWQVFNKMPSRNAVTWNTMILEHVKCGQGQKALDLFQEMQQESVCPTSGSAECMHHVVVLEEARCAHEQIIQSGCESHVIWRIAWWTCMQNVGAWRIIGDCSRRFHLEMWSPGPAWYWVMWNVGKGRRHWNYFDRCNRNICSQILLILWGCECMCQCGCNWRRQVCSWADHSKWMGFKCVCGE
jgi:pentatricopeptide repeat protein